jgi:hypothetical protein
MKEETSKKQWIKAESLPLLLGVCLLGFFEPEDRGSNFLRNVREIPHYMALYPRK